MRGVIVVETQEEFDAWMAGKSLSTWWQIPTKTLLLRRIP